MDEGATSEDFSVVQQEGIRSVRRRIKFYNLDAVISVGYRVNSKRGTQFRQWVTQRLKDHLLQGYTINEKRLAQKQQEVQTLKDGIRILSRAIEEKTNDSDFDWLNRFAKGLELLDDYDHERLDRKGLTQRETIYPEKEDYQMMIGTMKANFESAVFGKDRDGSFQSAVARQPVSCFSWRKTVSSIRIIYSPSSATRLWQAWPCLSLPVSRKKWTL